MKESIQFTQKNFQAILCAMPQIVIITNVEGEIIFLNEKWYQYTGSTPEGTKTQSWMSAIQPDDFQDVYKKWHLSRLNGGNWTQEYRLKRYDGAYRWHMGMMVADLDENGAVSNWVCTVMDIDDQKTAEKSMRNINESLEQKVSQRTKELSQANAFLDTVIENIPNMIFVKDAETLKFVRFNRAGEELIGIAREDLIGKGDEEFFPATEAEYFQERDRAVIAGRVLVDIPEERLSTKNGLRILHTKKLPVFDSSGKPRYLVGISEDITEKKKIEKERLQFMAVKIEKKETRRTAERFKFLAEASALLGSTLDYEEILKKLTQLSVPRMADWCSIDLIQSDRTVKQIAVAHSKFSKMKMTQEIKDKYPTYISSLMGCRQVIESGHAFMVSEVSPNLKELGFCSYICAPIRSRGKVLGAVTLVTSDESQRIYSQADLHLLMDISERAGTAVENSQLYKEAKHLNRVKDEFLATLSHELRTPLNVILGHAEILNSEKQKPDMKQVKMSVDAIYRNAKTQTGLINDLLDVSSIITGKISYKPDHVNPVEIIKNIVESLQATANAKVIRLVYDVSRAPKHVYADATRLHQIVWNLMSNAIKFTPQGGKVSVTVEMQNDNWEITVEDNGRGIDRDFLPYVFDRFRQEDASVTRSYGGLGLGLSIVRHLSELHGGSVYVESEGKGKGATFRVSFPFNLVGINAEAPKIKNDELPVTQLPQPAISLRGAKILLVEDSQDSRLLIQLMLNRAGAEIMGVESAQEAREKLKTFCPDIIISDVGMSEESGIEFIKKVRQSDLNYKNIPAIALTAYVRPEEKVAILKAGFQTHVSKPINKQNLLSEIKRFL
ncbi:MAG: PAS domain S-box protein [Bdellovibrionaceae bacterium]|nr:PAS domain S-box protein [Pseudobdellovibrionaceae bacterium]